MSATIENQYGNISIDEQVLANMIGFMASGCFGVIGMAGKKGDIVKLLRKDSLDKGVEINTTEDGIDVGLHIIVEYGVNIQAISQSIMERVRYGIEESTGLSVGQINVYVDSIRVD